MDANSITNLLAVLNQAIADAYREGYEQGRIAVICEMDNAERNKKSEENEDAEWLDNAPELESSYER